MESFQNGELTKHRLYPASVPVNNLLGSAALTMHVPPVDESTPVSDNRELVGKLLETVGLRLLNVTTVHQRY